MLNSLSVVGSNVGCIFGYDSSDEQYWSKETKSGEVRLSSLLRAGLTPPVSTQVFRQSVIMDCKGYNEAVTSGVDHDLWIRLISNSDPLVIPLWNFISERCSVAENDLFSGRTQMTNRYGERIRGIQASLGIWAPQLTQSIGLHSCQRFSDAYLAYLFFSCLKDKDVHHALVVLRSMVLRPRTFYYFIFHFIKRRFVSGLPKFPKV